MGVAGLVEPLVVVSLLVGGTWLNRNPFPAFSRIHRKSARRSGSYSKAQELLEDSRSDSDNEIPYTTESLLELERDRADSSPSLLAREEPRWRTRELSLLGFKAVVRSPNTAVFKGRAMSGIFQRFPFMIECWYWGLIYWVYQLGRAFTAVTLQQGTVHVARNHAFQLIEIEKRLHIFWELNIQAYFLQHPFLMTWINRIYSFIHIPGTILFLIWLFYYTITRELKDWSLVKGSGARAQAASNSGLYQARRRTMALCNLLAFVVFTLWPCMPPRLLSDKSYTGPRGDEARAFGFVDTVHGNDGAGSIWTENRFCNQYAAMPSLHFGYSLLIGMTILSIPLAPRHHGKSWRLFGRWNVSLQRTFCVAIGVLYPLTILIAIVSTANHFILDAVAGAVVYAIGWNGNRVLLNLLPLEDYFLWCLRLHKPDIEEVDEVD